MAGTGTKLINKLTRRTKSVREQTRKFNEYEKAYLTPKTLADSPRAFELMRKAERRMDSNFGTDTIGITPKLHKKYVATSVGRHDYGSGDYGTQAIFATGLIGYSGSGVQVGDVIEVLQQDSALFGQNLAVVAVTDSTHLRLTDVASLAFAGTKEVTTVTTVADSAGSLNSTYFLLSTPTTDYYVWYDNGSGVDPAVPSRTGVHVIYANNDAAVTIATLTKTALDAVSGAWTTTRSTATLTITDQSVGTTTDAANGTASPGFTINVVTQGANANPTPAPQANVTLLVEISEVKKSYT